MSNREFYKKFEQILNEIFGESPKSITPIESFFNKIRYDDLVDDFGKWKKTIKTSNDGIITTIYYILNGDKSNKFENSENNKLDNLRKELDLCIKEQNFEQAAILRDKIKSFENESSKLTQLKKELEIAIQEENFEKAIELRDELRKIN